jgi:hypothetical protein
MMFMPVLTPGEVGTTSRHGGLSGTGTHTIPNAALNSDRPAAFRLSPSRLTCPYHIVYSSPMHRRRACTKTRSGRHPGAPASPYSNAQRGTPVRHDRSLRLGLQGPCRIARPLAQDQEGAEPQALLTWWVVSLCDPPRHVIPARPLVDVEVDTQQAARATSCHLIHRHGQIPNPRRRDVML